MSLQLGALIAFCTSVVIAWATVRIGPLHETLPVTGKECPVRSVPVWSADNSQEALCDRNTEIYLPEVREARQPCNERLAGGFLLRAPWVPGRPLVGLPTKMP